MKEKILNNRKNGMLFLILFICLYAAGLAACIFGAIQVEDGGSPVRMILGIVWLGIGWLPFLGLKVLKPQEALVLTLFGNYVGTLRDAGFYFVNPFCVGVNPAAKTKLNQSGDVDSDSKKVFFGPGSGSSSLNLGMENGRKLSLKIMTLNNARQKINDCLGNPVEIGIAVTWRVEDTAKAVFQVDNYKEFLSLQCDTALRNIVRIYPYDVAREWTPPETDTRMRDLCGAPARWSPPESGMRFRREWPRPVWRLSRPALLTWPMRRRLRL